MIWSVISLYGFLSINLSIALKVLSSIKYQFPTFLIVYIASQHESLIFNLGGLKD